MLMRYEPMACLLAVMKHIHSTRWWVVNLTNNKERHNVKRGIIEVRKGGVTLVVLSLAMVMLITTPVSADKYNCHITFDQELGEITGMTGLLRHDYASPNNNASKSTMCAINWFNFNLIEGKNFIEIILRYRQETPEEYCQIAVRCGLEYIAETEPLPLFGTYDYAVYLYPREGFKVRLSNAETGEILVHKHISDPRVLSFKDTSSLQHYYDTEYTDYFKACSTIQWQFVRIGETWYPAIDILRAETTYGKTDIPGGYMETHIWSEDNYWNMYYRAIQEGYDSLITLN